MTTPLFVERKRQDPKLELSDYNIDPATEPNPNINWSHVYSAFGKIYNELSSGYKFVLADKQKRVSIAGVFKKIDSIATIRWAFTDQDQYKTASGELKRKIYKIIDQQVCIFYPFRDQKEVTVTLRTIKNNSILEDLQELAKPNGVDIVELPKVPVATIIAPPTGATGDIPATTFERDELERKLLAEQELADQRPLAYEEPLAFEKQNYVKSGSLFVGGITNDDLSRPLDGYEDESVSKTVELAPPVPTDAEMNQMGKDIYKQDKIHAQIVRALTHITKFFPPYVSITSPAGSGKSQADLLQTIYVTSDAQDIFENSYASIAGLGKMIIKIFPLMNPLEKESKSQYTQLWVRNKLNGEPISITNPDMFSVLFYFSNSAGYGYTIQKAVLVHGEGGKTKVELDMLKKLFMSEFERVIKTPIETSKKYSDLGKTTPIESDAKRSTEVPAETKTSTVVVPPPVSAATSTRSVAMSTASLF